MSPPRAAEIAGSVFLDADGDPEVNDKSSKQKRARNQADAQFARPQQTDKDSAMAEYKAQAQLSRDKTERLKALRLAREAAEEKAAPAKKAAAKKVVAKKRAPAKKATAKKAAVKKPA
jgi:hypothetical protein